MAGLLQAFLPGGAAQRSRAPLFAALAALAGFGLGAAVMAPHGPGAATAQACARVAATLLATRDAVELDRSRHLVRELGCDLRADLPAALDATADAAPGPLRAGAAPAGVGLGAFLLNALMVTVIFVGTTLLVLGAFNWLVPSRQWDT